jgi:FkbM family methyltransferase
MNQIKFFFRRVRRNLVNRLKLSKKLFEQNQLKLAEAKSQEKDLVDVMPGINLPMVIHPDMYFVIAYTKYIFEPDSLDFLRDHLKPGDTVLDIGANIGYFSLFCAKLVSPSGWVIAFEPGQYAFDLLTKNKQLNKLNNLAIYPAGLGEKDEMVQFNSGKPGMEVYNSLGDIVHRSADPNQFKKISVQLFQGSKWLKNEQIEHIDLVKLDVEGGEYTVLKGLLEMFQSQKISRLLIEITYEMSQAFGYQPSDIILMLSNCGYKWFRLSSCGRLKPLLGNDIGSSGMFVALSPKCKYKG